MYGEKIMYSKEEMDCFANRLRCVGCVDALVNGIISEVVLLEKNSTKYSVDELEKLLDNRLVLLVPEDMRLVRFFLNTVKGSPKKVKEILDD